MNPRRLIAAAAAVLTVLLLQATLLSPLTAPLAVSLPAVLVAAVGIEAGPSAGMCVGFSAGLLADLASRHPAGVLAIAWLLLGTACGLLAQPHRRGLTSVAVVAIGAGAIGLITAGAIALLHAPAAPLDTVIALALPGAAGDLVLALVVVPPVRFVARALAVRAIPGSVRARVVVDG